MSDYYDRDGRPMTMMEWARKFEDNVYKRVALDKVGPLEVSTVWLGLDHQFGDGAPVIFETMVFGEDREERRCERYSTEAEAMAGHQAMVGELRGRIQ